MTDAPVVAATGAVSHIDPPTDPDLPVVDPASDPMPEQKEPRDWAWVEEWRASDESVPWGLGLTVAVFTAVLVGSAIFVVSQGLADRPIIALVVNLAVAGGVAPAIWLSRGLPVLRWFAFGAILGLLGAWVSTLLFLT